MARTEIQFLQSNLSKPNEQEYQRRKYSTQAHGSRIMFEYNMKEFEF